MPTTTPADVEDASAGDGLYRYAAFISYSHDSDERTGPLLEAALEQFPAPRSRGKQRDVYLDRGDLGTTADLTKALFEALAASRHLILIASPQSAVSEWVQREVAWWLEHRGTEKLIIVHSSGRMEFAPLRTDALPRELVAKLKTEPNVVRLPALPPKRIDPEDPVWSDVLASIVATVDDVPKHALVGEHLRNLRRSKQVRTRIIAALTVLLMLAAAAGVFAFVQLTEAQRQQRIALGRLLLNQAQSTVVGDPQTALRLAVAARHLNPDPENSVGLARLLAGTRYVGTASGLDGQVLAAEFSPDGRALAAVSSEGTAMLWDTTDPGRVRPAGSPFTTQNAALTAVAFHPSSTLLATGDNDGGAALWDVRDLADPRPLGLKLTDVVDGLGS